MVTLVYLISFSIFVSFSREMVSSHVFLLELVDRFHDDACSKPCHMESLCLMYQMISYTHLQNNNFFVLFFFFFYIYNFSFLQRCWVKYIPDFMIYCLNCQQPRAEFLKWRV